MRGLLQALDFPVDESRSLEENLTSCLADFWLQPAPDPAAPLHFVIRDELAPDDFDWAFLKRIAPYVVNRGSYCEFLGDVLVRAEFVGNDVRLNEYEIREHLTTGEVKRGKRLQTLSTEAFPSTRSSVQPTQPAPVTADKLEIDTSSWRPDDAAWRRERAKRWKLIERMLRHNKSAKGINIIKQYFDHGTLPDWAKVNARWPEQERRRHLDLFYLVFCHPVQEYAVLKPLVSAYIESDLTSEADIALGYQVLKDFGLIRASENGKAYAGRIIPFEADAQMYARLFFEDVPNKANTRPEYETALRAGPGLRVFAPLRRYLALDQIDAYGEQFLLQYDCVLECLYANVCRYARPQDTHDLELMQQTGDLERLAQFDCAAEGDTARSRTVTRLRAMLDERPWIPALKDLWRDITPR